MKSFPEPLVQNQNNFTDMFLMLPSTKIDRRLNNMTTRAKKRTIFKSNILSHRPIHHLLICQDSGERSRALGPSSFFKIHFENKKAENNKSMYNYQAYKELITNTSRLSSR